MPPDECRCAETTEVRGADVAPFAQHLEVVSRNTARWETTYRCPRTSATWLQTYPRSEAQGGGPPLLARLPSAKREDPDR